MLIQKDFEMGNLQSRCFFQAVRITDGRVGLRSRFYHGTIALKGGVLPHFCPESHNLVINLATNHLSNHRVARDRNFQWFWTDLRAWVDAVNDPRLKAEAYIWTPPQLGVPKSALRFGFTVRCIGALDKRPVPGECMPSQEREI